MRAIGETPSLALYRQPNYLPPPKLFPQGKRLKRGVSPGVVSVNRVQRTAKILLYERGTKDSAVRETPVYLLLVNRGYV